jgi:hypothetical protein
LTPVRTSVYMLKSRCWSIHGFLQISAEQAPFLSSAGQVEDASSTPKRARPTRSLPAANHKASGFTAYRSNTAKGPRPSAPSGSSSTTRPPVDKGLPSSQPVGLARSLRANAAAKIPPPPRSLPRPGRSPTATRQDSDSHAHSPSLATPASEPRGTKRKLDDSAYVDELLCDGDGDGDDDDDDGDDDDSEIVILGVSEPDNTISSGGDIGFEMGFESLYPELHATPKAANTTVVEAEPLVVPNSKEWSGTATHNKVRDLVSAALEKAVEGEKQRVVLEAHLRQEIISLESRLQKERADHNFTKRRILDLEEGLITITSNVERTNALIQATSVQLLKDNCEAGGELSK